MTGRRTGSEGFQGLRVSGFLPASIVALEEGGARRPVPAGKSAFEWLAEPILEDFRDSYFYAQWFASTPVLSALMDEDEAWDETWTTVRLEWEGTADLTRLCFRPGVVTSYRRSIPDDWMVLTAFRAIDDGEALAVLHRFDDVVAAAEAGDRSRLRDVFRESGDLVCCCLDGLAWEFFPRSADHLAAISRRVSELGLEVVACEIEDSVTLGAEAG